MVEVVAWVVRHAEFLHHAAGAHVLGHRKRDNFSEPDDGESMVHDGAGAFDGEPASPGMRGQPPADFDTGHEGRIEARNGQPDEADAFTRCAQFDGPQSEAVLLEVSFDSLDQLIALLPRKRVGEVLHDDRISIDACEGLAVRVAPSTQQKPVCDDVGHGGSMPVGRSRRTA